METKIIKPILQKAHTDYDSQYLSSSSQEYKVNHQRLKTLIINYQENNSTQTQIENNEFFELLHKQINIYCNEAFGQNGLRSQFSKPYKLSKQEFESDELTNEVLLKIMGENSPEGKQGRLEYITKKLKSNFSLSSLLRVETRLAVGDYVTKTNTDGRYFEHGLNVTIRKDRKKLEDKIKILKSQGTSLEQRLKLENETHLGYFLQTDSLDHNTDESDKKTTQIYVTKEYGFEPDTVLENESDLLNPQNGIKYLLQNLNILSESEQRVMTIKINNPELSQTDISKQLETSSESVRQLIESSSNKYKIFSENFSKRKELENDPSFNISDYENIGYTKIQIDEEKIRILTDLIQTENITIENIREISELTNGFLRSNIPKMKKKLEIIATGKILNKTTPTPQKSKPVKPQIITKVKEKREEEIKIESIQEKPEEEKSLYDTLTLEQKMKLAMYQPKKINFRTFNRDLALGKFD